MYDASDRKHVRRAEKQSKVVEAQRHATLQTLMSTIEGRAWMHDLLFGCGVFSTPFTGDDPRTNFNCGVQSVGLRHFGEVVAVCPDYYLLMMREANERDAATERRSSQDPRGDVEGREGDSTSGDSLVERDDGQVTSE